MKIRNAFFECTILLIFTSITFAQSQNVEINGSVKISDLPTSIIPEKIVTVNPDSTLGSVLTSALIQKLDFARLNNQYSFTDANGVIHSLELTNTTSAHGGVSGINPNTHIAFVPGGASDSFLLFNIEGTNGACTVFHVEDDTPQQGMYFASDSGNTSVNNSAWGNATTQTFMIRFEGNTGHVLYNNTSFSLVCL